MVCREWLRGTVLYKWLIPVIFYIILKPIGLERDCKPNLFHLVSTFLPFLSFLFQKSCKKLRFFWQYFGAQVPNSLTKYTTSKLFQTRLANFDLHFLKLIWDGEFDPKYIVRKTLSLKLNTYVWVVSIGVFLVFFHAFSYNVVYFLYTMHEPYSQGPSQVPTPVVLAKSPMSKQHQVCYYDL